mmetsp:Transcript_28333/g.45997  ORF Transcript_28333/g.45997 Transcript_28333/m.45997 type:complete len:98 (-) Transcript_28333:524-817(-)
MTAIQPNYSALLVILSLQAFLMGLLKKLIVNPITTDEFVPKMCNKPTYLTTVFVHDNQSISIPNRIITILFQHFVYESCMLKSLQLNNAFYFHKINV